MFLIVSCHESRKSMRLARNRRQVKQLHVLANQCCLPSGDGGRGGATAVHDVWSENAL